MISAIVSIIQCMHALPENLLQQAEAFFYEKKYEQALQSYSKIEPKNAVIWYNIGLMHVHLEDYLQADIAFARAEKYGTWLVWKKIDAIKTYLAEKKDPDFVAKWSDQLAIFSKRCILSISMIVWQLLVLMLLLGVFMMYWYQKWNSYTNYWIISTLGFLVFSMMVYKNEQLQLQQGIVTQLFADVYAGPDSSFYIKDKIEQGSLLKWNQESIHGYYPVKYQNKCGWVHKKNIEIV
jgi:tetratricopeptide (TPR) repeat protein